jgi:uncharacterized protein
MNVQEREQLASFLSQLVAARVTQKDTDAEALIREAVARQPDAAYLLVQKAFLLEQAVKSSQIRIEQLQAEVDALRSTAQSRGGFIDANAWGNQPARMQPVYAPPPAAPSFAPPAAGLGSGWLGNVATTAAGVVAGSFLFQGIEHLIGGHHGGNGLFGGDALASMPSETNVVNNFFDSDKATANDTDFSSLSDGLDSSDEPWL